MRSVNTDVYIFRNLYPVANIQERHFKTPRKKQFQNSTKETTSKLHQGNNFKRNNFKIEQKKQLQNWTKETYINCYLTWHLPVFEFQVNGKPNSGLAVVLLQRGNRIRFQSNFHSIMSATPNTHFFFFSFLSLTSRA